MHSIGATARELSNLIGPDEVALETFRDWVKNSYEPLADDVLRAYAVPTPGDARATFIRAATGLDMTAPARWTAGAMQGVRSKAYLYNVTWNVPTSGGQQLGAPGTSIIHLHSAVRSSRHLRESLQNKGIQTGIHHGVPAHLQPAYANLGYGRGSRSSKWDPDPLAST